MKIIFLTVLIALSMKVVKASWKIECEVLDKNKGRSVVTFSSNYKLRDTEKVKFGNKDLYLKISKAVVAKKSHISIRNYNAKNKNKVERLWSVGKFINRKNLVSDPFEIKFQTNDNQEGTLKCKGL
tara:strand:+ start:1309 stop:1686 length:378 start_codon:yes stop_codon:yes gene_type:complete